MLSPHQSHKPYSVHLFKISCSSVRRFAFCINCIRRDVMLFFLRALSLKNQKLIHKISRSEENIIKSENFNIIKAALQDSE